MTRIAIVTDSVACVPLEEANRHSIQVIPVRVQVGSMVYEDSVLDLPQAAVRRLQEEPAIDTTPWPPEHYCRTYLKLGQTAGEKFGDEDEENIYWEVEVQPGQSSTATFTAPTEPGEYSVTCGIEGHLEAGMNGKLTVVAGE